jgi:hypothetical protein
MLGRPLFIFRKLIALRRFCLVTSTTTRQKKGWTWSVLLFTSFVPNIIRVSNNQWVALQMPITALIELHYASKMENNFSVSLTLYMLTWRIRWAPNNASKGQMGFNSAFKGLKFRISRKRSIGLGVSTRSELDRRTIWPRKKCVFYSVNKASYSTINHR